jgi:sugar-specific transcriptional regulator TrmB
MPPGPDDDPRGTAVRRLEQFGLSTYAARTFVALSSLGVATAREVSSVADVPRTRVYDAVAELRERGLAEVRSGTPKQFYAVSADTAARAFRERTRERNADLRTALRDLAPVEPRVEQRGVWTVDGRHAVADRVHTLIEGAADEIAYTCVERLLTDDLLDALADAVDRGVTVRLGGASDAVERRVYDRLPEAETFESLWTHADGPAGRVLLVDDDTTLTSVRVAANGGQRTETAVWARGEHNSLVVVMRAVFAWRLGED